MSKFNFFGNISGQNVSINGEDIIINGKHVNNTDSNGEQIDEVRKAPTKIKKLYVSSNVRVNISEGHEDVIVARLHGIASSKDFQFDVVPNSDSLRVTANIEGASSGGVTIINGTVISNSFNSLQLDIMLPLSSVEIISIQSKKVQVFLLAASKHQPLTQFLQMVASNWRMQFLKNYNLNARMEASG